MKGDIRELVFIVQRLGVLDRSETINVLCRLYRYWGKYE